MIYPCEARLSLPVEIAKIAGAGASAGAAVHAAAQLLLRSEISFWDVVLRPVPARLLR